MRKNIKGQTILEYTIIIVILLGAMLAMKDYVKRGMQGRWAEATDDMADQYDPQAINSSINYATQVNSTSIVSATTGILSGSSLPESGQWTNRIDSSNTLETKTGFTQVGS